MLKILPQHQGEINKFPGGFPKVISKAEAYQILNLDTNATKDEISKRHRKLLMLNHPDKGGSTFIALKINEAKEALTKEEEIDIFR